MTTSTHDIFLLPSNRKIEASHKESLLMALARRGLQLRSDCGGQGSCGKCLVRLGEAPFETSDTANSAESCEKTLTDHLACQTEVTSDLTVSISAASLSRAEVVIIYPLQLMSVQLPLQFTFSIIPVTGFLHQVPCEIHKYFLAKM